VTGDAAAPAPANAAAQNAASPAGRRGARSPH